jgi:hypothetical protein
MLMPQHFTQVAYSAFGIPQVASLVGTTQVWRHSGRSSQVAKIQVSDDTVGIIQGRRLSGRPNSGRHPIRVGTNQVGTTQVGTNQVGITQVGTNQVGITQVGIDSGRLFSGWHHSGRH